MYQQTYHRETICELSRIKFAFESFVPIQKIHKHIYTRTDAEKAFVRIMTIVVKWSTLRETVTAKIFFDNYIGYSWLWQCGITKLVDDVKDNDTI